MTFRPLIVKPATIPVQLVITIILASNAQIQTENFLTVPASHLSLKNQEKKPATPVSVLARPVIRPTPVSLVKVTLGISLTFAHASQTMLKIKQTESAIIVTRYAKRDFFRNPINF